MYYVCTNKNKNKDFFKVPIWLQKQIIHALKNAYIIDNMIYENSLYFSGSKNTNANPLSALQDLAKHLGMHEMNKTLENYTYNPNSNSLKKVSTISN